MTDSKKRAWGYSCSACAAQRTSAAEEIRDAIDLGTACLFCGSEKAPGTDYCDACKASEREEMARLTRRTPA